MFFLILSLIFNLKGPEGISSLASSVCPSVVRPVVRPSVCVRIEIIEIQGSRFRGFKLSMIRGGPIASFDGIQVCCGLLRRRCNGTTLWWCCFLCRDVGPCSERRSLCRVHRLWERLLRPQGASRYASNGNCHSRVLCACGETCVGSLGCHWHAFRCVGLQDLDERGQLATVRLQFCFFPVSLRKTRSCGDHRRF